MNRKQHMMELRNDLHAVARKLAASETGASAQEIVRAFTKERSALVKAASEYLIETALTRLVGDVMKRRANELIDVDQAEMFERSVRDVIAVPGSANLAGKWDRYRSVGRLPIGFLKQIVQHRLASRRKNDRFEKYGQMLEFVAPYVTSDEMKVDEALAAAVAENRAAARKR